MDFWDMEDLISTMRTIRMPMHHSITGGHDADPCESSQNRRTLETVLPTVSEVPDPSLNRKTLLLPFWTDDPWELEPKSIRSDLDTLTVYARPTMHWRCSTPSKIEALSTLETIEKWPVRSFEQACHGFLVWNWKNLVINLLYCR